MLSPALMLYSQQWRYRFPESIPALVRLQRTQARWVLQNLALLHFEYRRALWMAETAPPPVVILRPAV